jgi:septal ring factor EnvC (AmiA/AmiB activator)
MEPIRPDNDELRAERPDSPTGSAKAAGSAKPAPISQSKPGKAPDTPKTAAGSGAQGNGGSGAGVLWLLVIVLACVAGGGWYIQGQRIQALESQVEEADSWVRQSKLALARFEGTLSETGENLQQAGLSLDEQLASQKTRLDNADSEIRKLWVIANERNKQQLEQQAAAISELETALGKNRNDLVSVQTSVASAETALSDAVKRQQGERAELAARVNAVQTSASSLKTELAAANQKTDALAKSIDERTATSIRRFEQEQKLTTSSIESRIAALEKGFTSTTSGNGPDAVQREIDELKKTVEVIDSSRSQMTSRLVRLSQEVNDVQAKLAGQ